MELVPSAVEAQNPNHRTTREDPAWIVFFYLKLSGDYIGHIYRNPRTATFQTCAYYHKSYLDKNPNEYFKVKSFYFLWFFTLTISSLFLRSRWGRCHQPMIISNPTLQETQGFPAGPVVENPPANMGDTGSIPDLGGSHMQ